MLPLINNYGIDWNSPEWASHAVMAVPYADLGVIEIANEPDNHWFNQAGAGWNRPVDYANMIVRCSQAVEPKGIKILACASSMWQVSTPGWLAAMLGVPGFANAMQAGHIELTCHPYGLLSLANGEGYDRLRLVKSLAPHTPIWVTEVGAKAFNGGSTQFALQSEYAARYLSDLRMDPQLAAVFWFNHREWGPFNPNADNGWALVGPLTAAGTASAAAEAGGSLTPEHRPAWGAFQAGAQLVR